MNNEELKKWRAHHTLCPKCREPVESYKTTTGLSPYHDRFKCKECRYLGLAYELLPKSTEADDWYRLHQRCPECGEHAIPTAMGAMNIHGKPFFDDVNTAQCKCGWEGMVYQLVE